MAKTKTAVGGSSEEDPRERALAYLKNEMTDAEREAFEAEVAESETLRAEVEQTRQLLDSLSAAGDGWAVRMVNSYIQSALERGASDLHVIPEQNSLALNIRVDGRLQELVRLPRNLRVEAKAPGSSVPSVSVAVPPQDATQTILNRIKVMADMNPLERRLPQDGRVPVKFRDRDYDLRVSVVPTVYGERATIRILSRHAPDYILGLEKLNLGTDQVAALRRLVHRPSGLVVIAGRSDVGKTTLAYSLLLDLRDNTTPAAGPLNILSIEDPVELTLRGVSQIPVNVKAGLTFEAALRGASRSDPDVLYCAEMQTAEAASLIMSLVLPGTRVVTTLNAPGALGVVDRLAALGVEQLTMAEALAGAVALRLVRRICPDCAEEYRPSSDDLQTAGLSPIDDGPFRRGAGCETCSGTGFKGRIPLCEVLETDSHIRRRIAEGANADDLWPETFGRMGGSLWDDARAKVRAGQTTVEEVVWALFDYPHATMSNGNGSGFGYGDIFLLPPLPREER